MSRYSWIRNLFSARRQIHRQTPARGRLAVEALEDRVTPSAIGLTAPESYVEDTPLNLADIVVSGTVNATATLTLSDKAAGSLSTATSGTVTSSYNTDTGVWTAMGPVADVNALLAGVVFTPSSNFNADFHIATSITDDTGPSTGDKLVTGTSANDQPTANDLSFSTDEDTAFNGMLTGDDGDPEVAQALTFAITTQPMHGTVSLDPATGDFTYTPAADFTGPDSFMFTVTDDATAGDPAALTSAPGTGLVTITAVNDAPVVTVPGEQTTPEDIAVTIIGISVADADVNEGTGEIKITLSAGSGTLSVGTSVAGGLSAGQISGNGTNSVVLQGPIDAVNATLAAGVTFLGNLNFNGFDTLTVQADDLGNTGAGGPQTSSATVSIHVLSPAEQVAAIRQMVQDLAAAGAFKNKGRLNSLLTKLRQIDRALAKDHGKVAYNVTGAFINHVRAFRRARILTAAQADPLLAAATQLRTSLRIGGFEVSSSSSTSQPLTAAAHGVSSTTPSASHAQNQAHGQSTTTGNAQHANGGQSTDVASVADAVPGHGNGKPKGNSHGKGNGK